MDTSNLPSENLAGTEDETITPLTIAASDPESNESQNCQSMKMYLWAICDVLVMPAAMALLRKSASPDPWSLFVDLSSPFPWDTVYGRASTINLLIFGFFFVKVYRRLRATPVSASCALFHNCSITMSTLAFLALALQFFLDRSRILQVALAILCLLLILGFLVSDLRSIPFHFVKVCCHRFVQNSELKEMLHKSMAANEKLCSMIETRNDINERSLEAEQKLKGLAEMIKERHDKLLTQSDKIQKAEAQLKATADEINRKGDEIKSMADDINSHHHAHLPASGPLRVFGTRARARQISILPSVHDFFS